MKQVWQRLFSNKLRSTALLMVAAFLVVVQLFGFFHAPAIAQDGSDVLLAQSRPDTILLAQDSPAVVTPSGICTRDLNQCGNAGSCSCPDGYDYSPIVGYCVIEDIDDATSRGDFVRSVCSINAFVIPTTCTDEENQLGYPVKCLCPGSTYYDQRFGQCVASFR